MRRALRSRLGVSSRQRPWKSSRLTTLNRTPSSRQALRAVSLDMWAAVHQRLPRQGPGADQKMVFDRFHIMRQRHEILLGFQFAHGAVLAVDMEVDLRLARAQLGSDAPSARPGRCRSARPGSGSRTPPTKMVRWPAMAAPSSLTRYLGVGRNTLPLTRTEAPRRFDRKRDFECLPAKPKLAPSQLIHRSMRSL
jgi:hypothetical protein